MTQEELKSRLRGVTGGPVSPFRADLSLDFDALQKNVDETLKHPIRALLIAAGISEFHALTPAEAVDSLRYACVAGRERALMIGTVGMNAQIASGMAREMEKAGAGALLVLPPYYPNAAEAGLMAYYEAIGRASALPLIIYSRDWVAPTPEFVARIAERVPALVAWKDGQGDIRRYQRIMRLTGDRLLWLGGAGDDCAPGYYSIGVHGFTSSLSNLLPKLALRMAAAGSQGDFSELNRLVNRYVHPIFRIRERVRGYEVAVLKQAMEWWGIQAGGVRPPLARLAPEAQAELKALMPVLEEMR